MKQATSGRFCVGWVSFFLALLAASCQFGIPVTLQNRQDSESGPAMGSTTATGTVTPTPTVTATPSPPPPTLSTLETDATHFAATLEPTIRPDPTTHSTPAPPVSSQPDLANVRQWLYVIDIDLEPEIVDQIAASTYDMVVLDFIPSVVDETHYPMGAVVEQLHAAPSPKLVLAYVDVGEAEDYRTYWQPDWSAGDPEWILGADPDGWEGNYPVAYWYTEWRQIWLADDGLLQAILNAGFDGLYLDWLEAYSDEGVIALANRQGLDAEEEMIQWVADIAGFTRNRRSGFLLVGQNATGLVRRDDYLALVDAIAQEHVWFDGGSDNAPPGDCPLPRTEADLDSQTYRNNLPPSCDHVYDDPDSTLHVSSQEYLDVLIPAQRQGTPVFTVDYALHPNNVRWVYQTSRSLGFIPFVSSRALDRYVEPYGDGQSNQGSESLGWQDYHRSITCVTHCDE